MFDTCGSCCQPPPELEPVIQQAEIEKARTFILWFLENRPAMVRDVLHAAEQRGISAKAMFAARIEMPVHTFDVSRWHELENCPPASAPQKWYKCWELYDEESNGTSYGIVPGP